MVIDRLFELRDEAYAEFTAKLLPTVGRDRVIGIRMPAIRSLARELDGTDEATEFLAALPHYYYEENNLHAFLVARIRGFDETLAEVERLLPYIDNWATCDQLSPKVFKKHRGELLNNIKEWINSDRTYTIRFGIGMLMEHFLDEDFDPKYPEMVSKIRSDEYYVNMMIAWYFATALAKQYEAVLPYIEEKRLAPWAHNKAIQKAVESYRITDEQKAYLKTLKVKAK